MNQPGSVNGVGGTELAIFVVGLVVVLLVIASLVARSFAQHDDVTRDLGADVDTGLALLARRIDELDAAQRGEAAAQALADARDRLAAAQELRRQSPTLVVSKAARAALLEGLTAARESSRLAGHDPGQPVPPPTDATLVAEPMRVRVGSAEHLALPAYAPGHPHHFSGGMLGDDEVPGGWYSSDFWSAFWPGAVQG